MTRSGGVDVAILADAPTLTTGFGRTTRCMASALIEAGRTVACFGLKAGPTDVDGGDDVRVWPGEQGAHWTESLPAFFAEASARVLLLNMDAYNALECAGAVRAAGWDGPIVSYVVFDGLPVTRRYLDVQRSCDAVVTSSTCAARYLGGEGVHVAGVAPPGVDTKVFAPGLAPEGTRSRLGLPSDGVVVGVFGTNTERKQIPRVLAALTIMEERLAPTPVGAYLHCAPDGHWPLGEVVGDLGLGDRVAFAAQRGFDEHRGIPLTGAGSGGAEAPVSYVDRLRACDVVVNAAHSGDVEQVILESQACGVPLVHTDDGGVMAEAAGDSAVLVPGSDVGMGRTGQAIHHVAPADIAEAAVGLLTDAGSRATVRERGLRNAAVFGWDRLARGVVEAVGPFLGAP